MPTKSLFLRETRYLSNSNFNTKVDHILIIKQTLIYDFYGGKGHVAA